MTRQNMKDSSKAKKVKKVIELQDVFLASEKDRTIFFEAIAKDEMPNKKLVEAATRYKNELCKK